MAILSREFKSIIKAHGLNPWQFIYPKPNSHWQYQNSILISNIKSQFLLDQIPIFIGNIKTQFSLALSKPSSRWQYLKPNFHWQHQNPILIGNIKAQFSLAIFKTQFSLTISNLNSHWQYQKPNLR